MLEVREMREESGLIYLKASRQLYFVPLLVGFAATGVTSVVVETNFERAEELLKWHDDMISNKTCISLMPSKQIQRAIEMKLIDILDDKMENTQQVYCKFNAKIEEVLDKHRLWYTACKKCWRRVEVVKSTVDCAFCVAKHIDFEDRLFHCHRIIVLLDMHHELITTLKISLLNHLPMERESCLPNICRQSWERAVPTYSGRSLIPEKG